MSDIPSSVPGPDAEGFERALVRFFLDSVPDCVAVKDRNLRYVAVSMSQVRLLGCTTREEVLGKTEADFVPEAEACAAAFEELRILQTGDPVTGRVQRGIGPGGLPVSSLINKLPWKDEKGAVIGVCISSKDVSELVRSQTALRESHTFYHSLVESLPQSIMRKDREGRFTFVNKLVCEALGKKPYQILGKTDLDFYPKELAEKYRADDARVMREKRSFETVEQHVKSDGERRYVHAIKVPLVDHDGEVIGIQCVFWDVTAQYRTLEQLDQTQQKLLAATRQAGMAEVATNVLHNVGNVLNSVSISAKVVSEGMRALKCENLLKLDAMFKEHAADLGTFFTQDPKGKLVPQYIETFSKHILENRARMLDELASLQRNIGHIEEIVAMQQSYATMLVASEKLDPAQLIDDALHLHAAPLLRHNVRVERECMSAPPVWAERGKVLQILVNLISNAKYACDASGAPDKAITVRVEASGEERVRLIVRDNGIGIAPENMPRIFSQGFTTRTDGHGFGLHACVLAAQDMKGSLFVRSEGVGRGATFTLELPRAKG